VEGILTLDLATATGWAFWKPGMAQPRHGVWRMPSTGEDIGRFLDAFHRLFEDFCTLEKPAYIGFEAPVGYSVNMTNPATTTKLYGLATHVEWMIYRLKGPSAFQTNISQVRKHFCGRVIRPSDEMKRLVYDTCSEFQWFPHDDNAADALSMLHYSAYVLRKYIEVPWDTRPQAERIANPLELA
jgi:crossover junction endodeoxyribonuclease RuvC